MGYTSERSEDGEGKPVGSALSVTFGDSSPKGRAKRLYPHLAREVERICIDTLHNALWLPTKRDGVFRLQQVLFQLFQIFAAHGGQRKTASSAVIADELHGGFYGDGVDLAEQQLNEGQQLCL